MLVRGDKEKGLFINGSPEVVVDMEYEAPITMHSGIFRVARIGAYSIIQPDFYSVGVLELGRYSNIAPRTLYSLNK